MCEPSLVNIKFYFEMQNALNFTLYTPPLFLLKVGGEFQF